MLSRPERVLLIIEIGLAAKAWHPSVVLGGKARLAVIQHRRNQSAQARQLCTRSAAEARAAGNDVLAAEALNALGVINLELGALAEARSHFLRAVQLGGASRELRARVEQNLGILANI